MQNVWARGDWRQTRISTVGRKQLNRGERVLLNSQCPRTNTNVQVVVAVHLSSLLAILVEFFYIRFIKLIVFIWVTYAMTDRF